MSHGLQWIAFKTIVRREMRRVVRIWAQTLFPPVVTTTLYFVIFGGVIGRHVGEIQGYPYITFIAPGLIMLSIINNSYSATVSAFFSAKFQRSIEELLVSPVWNSVILIGYMMGGIFRGVLIGIIVAIIASFFTTLGMYSFISVVVVAMFSSAIFSLGGLINAIYAKSFDDISIIPTFVLTPLTYLGGVFYSIKMLPPVWQYISMVNPIVYIVDAFRYGFLGIDGLHVWFSFLAMFAFIIILFFIALYLIAKGQGLRE